MTKQVEYTDHFTPASSVIDEVFYDAKNYELYVILHNGAQPAYRGVSQAEFDGFKNASSAGSYWNRYIKDGYTGISGDVEFVDPQPVPAASEPEFVIVVEVNGTLTITGNAKDGNEALRRVNQVLEETFKGIETFRGTAKVKTLTQNFV